MSQGQHLVPGLAPVTSCSSRSWKCKPVKYAAYRTLDLVLCLAFWGSDC